ncbi:hypothetical protein [Cetobacterium sp.]|uniref:hypothetical protein n=1 Tax=Cetobacterium sp. TaxID=2071632 RepID=UPI003F304DB9
MKNCWGILVFLVIIFKTSYSYINIYPYRVYLDVQKGKKNEEIILYNKTTTTLRYKLSLKDKKMESIISFYPSILTLKPGEEKEIKLKLENNWKELEKKEHASEILIEQLKVPVKNSKGEFVKSRGVEVYPKIKIPLKVYLGNKEISLKKSSKTSLKNIGERELAFEIYYRKNKKDKNTILDLIESVRLKSMEEIDLKGELKARKIEIEDLEIYEKESNLIVKID